MGRLTVVELPRRGAPDLARDTLRGLSSEPKSLPSAHFYDETGSRLFEDITRSPEYYLGRMELSILREHAAQILTGLPSPITLVELGSGSSTKTRALIEAALERQKSLHYVAIDISRSALFEAARALLEDYPRLTVTACAGDYHAGLSWVKNRKLGPSVGALLGSTIGNFKTAEARDLLCDVSRCLDGFILGADLQKDRAVLEAAYNDAAGVTARFNMNLLRRINAELGGKFDPAAFRHLAFYDLVGGRIEMHLESLREQDVPIGTLRKTFHFGLGERIHTEDSRKFTLRELESLARQSGWLRGGVWLDERGWFSVILLQRR